MAVFRVEKTKDFTIMSNHHLHNTELSLKAKGLLTSWESKSSPLSNLSGRNTPIFWNKNGNPILPISSPKMI